MRFACLITSVLGIVAVAGCGMEESAAPASGGMAIVDLDGIAKKLGRDQEMNAAIQQRQDAINQQLNDYRTALKQQFEKQKAEFGENPTDEQKQELALFEAKINQRFAQERAKAQNQLAAYQRGLIAEFREEVKPIAQKVAAENGMKVVVPKTDLIFAFQPEADITDRVVAAMPASSAAKSAAPAVQTVSHEEPAETK